MEYKITKKFDNSSGMYRYYLWRYKKFWMCDIWICIARGWGTVSSDWARHYGIDKP